MEKLFDKLSSYNLFNNLLPGIIISTIITKMIISINFTFNLLESLFLYYFVGMIISRIGSLIVEPACRYCHFVRYAEYSLYLDAIKIDQSISILLETNNMYRTFLTGILIILLFEIYSIAEIAGKTFCGEKLNLIIVIGMILLFAFSYRKQTSYIRKRILKYTGNTID